VCDNWTFLCAVVQESYVGLVMCVYSITLLILVENMCDMVIGIINRHPNILHHEIITMQLGLLKCISFAL
jgi:hypothetical protein